MFACNITDRDYLAAFAPEQPADVKVGQRWMCVETGAVYLVKRVSGVGVDLGTDTFTVLTEERFLRRDYVCIDPPENVTELRAPAVGAAEEESC